MQKSVNTEARDAAIVEVHRTGYAYFNSLRDVAKHASDLSREMLQGWHKEIAIIAEPMSQNTFVDPIAAKAQFDYAVIAARVAGATDEQISRAIRGTDNYEFKGVYQG